ncbi:hypothetical protein K1Y37_17310, partial [Serratia marcescens]|nr:hypothetical protein [Serratia marcescens]
LRAGRRARLRAAGAGRRSAAGGGRLSGGETQLLTAAERQKARSGFPERASLNMAPLTGIAFTSNWLIIKLILNYPFVKTTRMTTN